MTAIVQGVCLFILPLSNPYQQSFDLRIIPQAVSVRYGLAVGATCAPLVLVMMYIFGSQNLPNYVLQSKKKDCVNKVELFF